MKKIICIGIVLAMASLLLVACGSAAENNPTIPTVPSLGIVEGGLENNVDFDTEPTEGSSVPTQPTQPSQSATEPSTAPSQGATQPTTQPTTPTTGNEPQPVDPATMDFATFQAMTGAEQRAFQESFEDLDAFFEWYNAAKEAYEKENPSIEIGPGGSVDLGGLDGNG